MDKKVIVVSAVNLTEGGGLTILKQCLTFLNYFCSYAKDSYRIVALVNSISLFDCRGIEYVEIPKAKKSWLWRLYYEYYGFMKLSKKLKPYLWLSLHDMTPNVKSEIRAVYCHNPTPFYKIKPIDLRFNYKIILFSFFYKYLYKINIKKNDYVIVQQKWLKEEFAHLFSLNKEKLIVAIPEHEAVEQTIIRKNDICKTIEFFYPTISRQFKNIETVCEAARILHRDYDLHKDFKVVITINGTEDSYAKWITDKYGCVPEIEFTGRLPFEVIKKKYKESSCLLFPSRLETWGLPITEFMGFKKPMIIADLPYAHETAAGAEYVAFFAPTNAEKLASLMNDVVCGNLSSFKKCPMVNLEEPYSYSWEQLFSILLKNKNDKKQLFNT